MARVHLCAAASGLSEVEFLPDVNLARRATFPKAGPSGGRGPHQFSRRGRVHRLAESRPLRELAAKLGKLDRVGFRLRPLGDDVHPDLLRHGDDRTQDGRARAEGVGPDQRCVDPHRVETVLRQVAERGVAGAEPVEHERRADFAHPLQERRGVFRVFHHQTLRRGELERAALDVMAAERGAHVEQQVVAQHLARRRRDGGEDGRIDLERLLPRRELPGGRLQSVGADVDDRAGRLGGGEEFILAEDSKPWMAPTDQRLESGDGSILQAHDRPKQN